MSNNINAKRNQISDVVVMVKSRRNNVVMAEYHPDADDVALGDPQKMKDVQSTIPATMFIISNLIVQKADNGFKGQLGIIAPDDLVLKAFIIQKYVNSGNPEGAKDYFLSSSNFSWMSNEWKDAMEYFIDAFETATEAGIVLVFTKESELFQWELKGDFSKLKDGAEITLHSAKNENGYWQSMTEDGTIGCSGNKVDGKFRVHEIVINNTNKGTTRSIWRIDRELQEGDNYDMHIKNLRIIHDDLIKKLPTRKILDPKNFRHVKSILAA